MQADHRAPLALELSPSVLQLRGDIVVLFCLPPSVDDGA